MKMKKQFINQLTRAKYISPLLAPFYPKLRISLKGKARMSSRFLIPLTSMKGIVTMIVEFKLPW
jgi:hypothetical protein